MTEPLPVDAQQLFGPEVTPTFAYMRGISAAALMAKTFPPIRWITEKYIAEGLSVLAGAPKSRKSWLMLDVAHAVAGEGLALGCLQCEPGDVLFLALEDNQRRLQDRLKKMGVTAPPERLTFCTEWPSGAKATEQIEAWARSVPKPVLVVVDVLARVREFTGREASYEADYRALVKLQDLATRLAIAIVVVHHTRKAGADDPFDEVSGTRGLTGAADTILVIRREITGGPSFRATLYGRGRDIPEIETAIEFSDDDYRWKVLGDAWQVADTAERQEIFDLLREAGQSLKLAEIAEALGKSKSNVSHLLRKLVNDGLVSQPAYGVYALVQGAQTVQSPSISSPSLNGLNRLNGCPRCADVGCDWCKGTAPADARDHAPADCPMFDPNGRLAPGECYCDPVPGYDA